MALSARYSAAAIVLHWAIAVLIVMNFTIGLKYEAAHGLDKFTVLQWHKSFGFTVLALSLLRLALRLTVRPPPYPATMKRWEKAVAKATHWAFYILIIGLPLTGWVVVSASPTNIPTLLFKAVPFPHLGFIHDLPMDVRRPVTDGIGKLHATLAFGMAALVVLHVAAALKHQFIDKDGVLGRMIPGLRP